MSKNELTKFVLGKNLTLKEALLLAFQCGMDYEYHEQGEATKEEVLAAVIPRVTL